MIGWLVVGVFLAISMTVASATLTAEQARALHKAAEADGTFHNAVGLHQSHQPQLMWVEQLEDKKVKFRLFVHGSEQSGDADLPLVHVMNEKHHIEAVWVENAAGDVVFVHEFDWRTDREPVVDFVVESNAEHVTPFEKCNLHGVWKGPPVLLKPYDEHGPKPWLYEDHHGHGHHDDMLRDEL